MIKCNDWPIGVCTWSLGNDFDKMKVLAEQSRIGHLHFGVGPALGKQGEDYLSKVREGSWQITATMIDFPQEDYSTLESIKVTGGIVPDECWDDNRERVFDAIDVTAELGVKYLTLHFGFLDLTEPDQVKKLYERARVLGDRAGEKNIELLMETGQEAADELLRFLEGLEHPAFGVNFDPANMILYDKGNPIEAVQTLGRWVKHVHIKDALRTKTPGTWGVEVPWGQGQVGSDEFLNALKQINFEGALAVEREAVDDRVGDIKIAVDVLKGFGG